MLELLIILNVQKMPIEKPFSLDYDEEMDCLAREVENLEIKINPTMYQSINHHHKSHLQSKAATNLMTLMILMKRELYHLWIHFSSMQTSNHWVVFLLVPGIPYLKKHSYIIGERPVRSLQKFSAL